MTGWRIGWMVVPEDHIRQIERLAQNMFICAPHASQVAALHAIDCKDELNLKISKLDNVNYLGVANPNNVQDLVFNNNLFIYFSSL